MPTGRVEVVATAVPDVSRLIVCENNVPEEKVTVPVGIPAEEGIALTIAVRVTCPP
jgi:hypothetical protein